MEAGPSSTSVYVLSKLVNVAGLSPGTYLLIATTADGARTVTPFLKK